MIIEFEPTGELQQLHHILQKLDSNPLVQGILIYTCDNNLYTPSDLDPLLKQCQTQLFGGIFPSIIYNKEKFDRGSIVVGFTFYVQTIIVKNIHDQQRVFKHQLEAFYPSLALGQTILVNFDGLSDGVEAFKEELFYALSLSKNYIGGGAGSLSFIKRPCVISNEGLLQDAALVTLLDVASGVGVAHGWESISEPLKITEVDRNKIISLNWEPAAKVYKEHILKLTGKTINETNFFSIAKGYPFGISKMGNEMIVRDPIGLVDHNHILCVGEIPLNAFVYILHGTTESLIAGAIKAKQLAYKAFWDTHKKDAPPQSITLFIDCISRVLYLGEDFQQELDAIGSDLMIGALTLGELANTGKAYLELYNKTSVIALLEA